MDIKENNESPVLRSTELQLHDSVCARTGKPLNYTINNYLLAINHVILSLIITLCFLD